MEILILSCSTGGGHNSAGIAIKDELLRRGHSVTMMDPYSLSSARLAAGVGNVYVRMVQRFPRVFGFVYLLGELVRRMPFLSPVYWVNGKMRKYMKRYLAAHKVDAIVMPHLFPAEIFTYMKKHGDQIPPTVFVATDYACIPFTEETSCDYYVIPGEGLIQEFAGKGIPKKKLVPIGIPVRREFARRISKEEAKDSLGLRQDKEYLLISGGSMGAGAIQEIVKKLDHFIQKDPKKALIIICGNNDKLYRNIVNKYGNHMQILVLKSTQKMADYMSACEGFFTKPGGLSTTEAAVVGVPIFHITPIPGCETANMKYFTKNGMSRQVGKWNIRTCLELLEHPQAVDAMKENQRQGVNPKACQEICDFIERLK
jgi:processive 1,2-diacylglycerol beta-glucosyltransferase